MSRGLLLGIVLAAIVAALLFVISTAGSEVPSNTDGDAAVEDPAGREAAPATLDGGAKRRVLDPASEGDLFIRVLTESGLPAAITLLESQVAGGAGEDSGQWELVGTSTGAPYALEAPLADTRYRASLGERQVVSDLIAAGTRGEIVLTLAGDPASTNVVLTGRVLAEAARFPNLRVRLAWVRPPDPKGRLDAQLKWQHHIEAGLYAPDWPNARYFKRGRFRTLADPGEFWAEIAWGQEWELVWMRVEVWHVPPGRADEVAGRDSTLIAFSRPFELAPGLRWRVEDLTAVEMLRCVARLVPPPVAGESGQKATWTLMTEPSQTRESLGVEPIVLYGKWDASGVLDVPLPGYFAGKPFQIGAHRGQVTVSSATLLLAPGVNDFGTLQLPSVAHLSGRVVDARSGEGIGGQAVRLARPAETEVTMNALRSIPSQAAVIATSVTEGNGHFFFDSLPAGTYEVQTANRPNGQAGATGVRGSWTAGSGFVTQPVELITDQTSEVELIVAGGLIRLHATVEGISAFPAYLSARYGSSGERDMALVDAREFTIDVAAGEAVLLSVTRTPRADEEGAFEASYALFAPDGGSDTAITLRPYATRHSLEMPASTERGSIAVRPMGDTALIHGFPAPIDTYYVQMNGLGSRRDLVGLPPGEYEFRTTDRSRGALEWTATIR